MRAGGYEAVVASIGASLRVLTYEGRDLVVPFAPDELRPVHRGATLAPWPNRVVDGRYAVAGRSLGRLGVEPLPLGGDDVSAHRARSVYVAYDVK